MREQIKDVNRLRHMLEAIDNVSEFTKGVTFDNLVGDKILCHAIIHNIQVVGEAAYKLTKEFCLSHPEVEWRDIIALRHVLVHDYFRIDMEELWHISKEELLPLREQIDLYLKTMPE
ncbi:MAG: DUF86 domain-containing protein [Bacteroidales bacterium]|nr:DUF86 domain-containing protein [Bacteroidales bacterium]